MLEEQNYIFLEIECLEDNLSNLKENDIELFNTYVKTLGITELDLKTLSYKEINEKYNLTFRPEYSKLIGFSLGYYKNDNKSMMIKINFDSEYELLKELKIKLDSFHDKKYILSGFMLADHKIPYLIKKYLYYNIKPPIMFNDYKLKPWEKRNLDLSEITKFGSYKPTSLNDLAFGFRYDYFYDREHILNLISKNSEESNALLKKELENKIKTVMEITSKISNLL